MLLVPFTVLALALAQVQSPAHPQSPAQYRARLETTKGPIVIEVHRDWAPNGADRFFELVTSGYYDDTRFFRVVQGRLEDLSATQDEQGFVPFGRVVSGMEVADSLNSEYGDSAGGGIRAGQQEALFDGGNAYLDRDFPRLDRIIQARILP